MTIQESLLRDPRFLMTMGLALIGALYYAVYMDGAPMPPADAPRPTYPPGYGPSNNPIPPNAPGDGDWWKDGGWKLPPGQKPH